MEPPYLGPQMLIPISSLKKIASGSNPILASRCGVSAAKAWPQRSIVAHADEKLILLKPPSLAKAKRCRPSTKQEPTTQSQPSEAQQTPAQRSSPQPSAPKPYPSEAQPTLAQRSSPQPSAPLAQPSPSQPIAPLAQLSQLREVSEAHSSPRKRTRPEEVQCERLAIKRFGTP